MSFYCIIWLKMNGNPLLFLDDNINFVLSSINTMCHKLEYPSFSVVFIQTFSIRHELEFILPVSCTKIKEKDKKADELKMPIVEVERGKIEDQIFILPENSPHEKIQLAWWQIFSKLGWRRQPEPSNLQRYSLRGFNFKLEVRLNKGDLKKRFSGHCDVEMNLFYGHLVSLTYRFLFNRSQCYLPKTAETDHIITLLSTWLNGEFWSKEKNEKEAKINLYADFDITKIWFDENGEPLREFRVIDNDPKLVGRSFDKVAERYKRYIYKYCTRYRHWYHFLSNYRLKKYFKDYPVSVEEDSHYAMVDVGGDIRHPLESGEDYFAPGTITEPEIIDHIRKEHKSELMGLISLYPKEWPYRDPADYDEVCGGSIAIDSDDLVLVGSSVCLVLGTYTRRDEKSGGVDWKKVCKERARYHVYWPEYLMILQMVLAKKYILDYVADQLVFSTLEWEKRRPERMLEDNAYLSVRLMRLLAQLDVLKYAKFPSHKVMYDRTCERLKIAEAQERTNTLIENMDAGLNNLKDLQASKRESMMNVILGIVSVVSAFQLLFVEHTKFNFWETLWPAAHETNLVGAIVILIVAAFAIFVLFQIGITVIFLFFNKFRK